jgi:hypothetical protein
VSHLRNRENDGDPEALPVVFSLVVGVILCAVVIILLQAAYLWLQAREDQRKVIAPTFRELEDFRFAEEHELRTVGWSERTGPDTGTVRIPLERARQLFLAEEGHRR